MIVKNSTIQDLQLTSKEAGPNGSQIIFDQQPVSSSNLLFSSLSFKGKSSLKNDASYSLLVGKI